MYLFVIISIIFRPLCKSIMNQYNTYYNYYYHYCSRELYFKIHTMYGLIYTYGCKKKKRCIHKSVVEKKRTKNCFFQCKEGKKKLSLFVSIVFCYFCFSNDNTKIFLFKIRPFYLVSCYKCTFWDFWQH